MKKCIKQTFIVSCMILTGTIQNICAEQKVQYTVGAKTTRRDAENKDLDKLNEKIKISDGSIKSLDRKIESLNRSIDFRKAEIYHVCNKKEALQRNSSAVIYTTEIKELEVLIREKKRALRPFYDKKNTKLAKREKEEITNRQLRELHWGITTPLKDKIIQRVITPGLFLGAAALSVNSLFRVANKERKGHTEIKTLLDATDLVLAPIGVLVCVCVGACTIYIADKTLTLMIEKLPPTKLHGLLGPFSKNG